MSTKAHELLTAYKEALKDPESGRIGTDSPGWSEACAMGQYAYDLEHEARTLRTERDGLLTALMDAIDAYGTEDGEPLAILAKQAAKYARKGM
jgi:hypothetical protein